MQLNFLENRQQAEAGRKEQLLLRSRSTGILPGNENLCCTMLSSMMEGFQVIDSGWRYIYVNDALLRQTRCGREELIGHTMMEKYPGIEHTRMFAVLQRCMRDCTSACLENEFCFPDGSRASFDLRIHPVPSGLLILSVDITERLRAEQKKKEYIRGLEELIFMTSHELRQPVAHILGISNILSQTAASPEELEKMLNYIREAAQALDDFTRRFTDIIHGMKTRS